MKETRTYTPTLRFLIPRQLIEEKSEIGGSRSTFTIGQSVKIKYDPRQPKRCMMIDPDHELKNGAILIVAGIVFAIIGKVLYFNVV